MEKRFEKWIPIFPNDERAKFDDEYVGFKKKNAEGYHMGGCYMYAYDPTDEIVNRKPDHLDIACKYIGTSGSSTHRGICSRTLDFSGTVMRGLEQKNPYENGMYFRALFGEENKRHLYVAYMPMGYGEKIKLLAHKQEGLLLRDYKETYGSLPQFDGRLGPEIIIKEYAKALTVEQLTKHIAYCESMLVKCTH